MSRYRLLDLFSGDGGAGEGYRRAGFEVVGVDLSWHNYPPGRFFHDDAVRVLDELLSTGSYRGLEFDAVHASPPCQRWSTATRDHTRHPDLVTPVRERLKLLGLPYIIENVPAAPLIDPVQVCGSALGLKVRRHRRFESNVPLVGTHCAHKEQGVPVGVYGQHADTRRYYRPDGTQRGTKALSDQEGRDAMGISWPMTWADLAEAIPPAYTELLGSQLLEAVRRGRAA